MKRFLVVLAAVGLSGCAYSQFKADYLQQYASHDCIELDSEMNTARDKLQVFRLQSHKGISGPARRGVWVYYIDPLLPGGYTRPNERRMRIHARHEALLQLEASQGCEAPLKQ